ncbi:Fur family transcriptional regulator [Phaeobacter gallaeciensis]|uniref:Zinc uptake regulation protein zur-like protein n=1 Tax=Phaeobacter gallaeciensis TaxID=60890 RepID=A0AAC9ZD59_9RHOB|nr:Fur family transcriptional regulator [Phaeobacter gallaeciensis]AHD11650.1 Fe2+/Zn2+ uptake regulation protein [Phaeobacter gallaeciensis DSM 26640]ATE94914.1 zinc uptake regulation protein zur-like protein [Phaeobacter gallaeciensis]ATE99185.1 zinc uptake regulation protein zur-like protein [Phaeobacter gallaeciensis]ATF03578.1 zinc uptake regulation protein zur-like protein [Phaeobacter gallaeciensis]ATF07958.1 zinc uptake regulation protein zur-like protein [Phaeobacter gallaeciensis]
MDPIGFHAHDHSHCISDGIAVADAHCRANGLQFTPVRRRVLEILLQAHRAMGAYDLLDILRSEGLGSQPPIAYRALDFLVKNGFAHKIERLNAFVACSHPGDDHAPVFMICRTCNAVAEAPSQTSNGRLGAAAREAGFLIERTVMEAEGLCPKCQTDDAP